MFLNVNLDRLQDLLRQLPKDCSYFAAGFEDCRDLREMLVALQHLALKHAEDHILEGELGFRVVEVRGQEVMVRLEFTTSGESNPEIHYDPPSVLKAGDRVVLTPSLTRIPDGSMGFVKEGE